MKNIFRLTPTIILFMTCAVPPLSLRGGEKASGHLKAIAMVRQDIVELTLIFGKITPGHQEPYQKNEHDDIRHGKKETFLYRNGKFIGTLVGKDKAILYRPPRVIEKGNVPVSLSTIASFYLESVDPKEECPQIQKIFRKTYPIDLRRTGPWDFSAVTETKIYLLLNKPLPENRTYRLTIIPLEETGEFTWDSQQLVSSAIHVNQLGFAPTDPQKLAFLSCWMGDGGGLTYPEGTTFSVIDAASNQICLRGQITLRLDANAPEDAYKRNLNNANIYQLDFSSLNKKGSYFIHIPGIGRSEPFTIHQSCWQSAWKIGMKGLYHQRSGIELGPPWTSYRRPRCFHPEDGVKIFASTCPLMESKNGLNYSGSDKNNFYNLLKGKTSQLVPDAWGGYMDAGDWDRRIQHLQVTLDLLDLFRLSPRYFSQIKLSIPRDYSQLPDILNEALFNLDCYRRMQTADGGIRGGIESAEHPVWGEASWQESLPVMAYAPGMWSSHYYAATAARAAYVLRKLDPKLSAIYEQSAIKAMAYAEKLWPRYANKPKVHRGGIIDIRNLAAAELYRLTGDKHWHEIFLATTVFTKKGTPLSQWPTHDQAEAAWVYLSIANPEKVQNDVWNNCLQAYLSQADTLARYSRKTGFGWTRNPWRPASYGAFTYPETKPLCRAYWLSRQRSDSEKARSYYCAAVDALQFVLGANPLNLSYTTGLGHRSVRHPLHVDSRISNQPPPAGITVYGPMGYREGKNYWSRKLVDLYLFPAYDRWPAAESYWDIFWSPAMCEFTVSQMSPLIYTWGCLAAFTAAQHP